jgi:hypothetical protein
VLTKKEVKEYEKNLHGQQRRKIWFMVCAPSWFSRDPTFWEFHQKQKSCSKTCSGLHGAATKRIFTAKIKEANHMRKEGDMMKLEEYIKSAEEIEIVSGEGEQGTVEDYEGKRTIRAIKARLTKERCGGDRWAFVRVNGQRIDLD